MSLIVKISSVLIESRSEKIKMIIALSVGLMTVGVSFYEKQEEKQLKKENQVYEVQMVKLMQVQDSINNLSEFIHQQKEQIKQSQHAVESLIIEQKSLKFVVEANREVVDSILKLHANRVSANVWQERFIGFGLCIASSLIASLIWAGIRRGRNV